MPGFSFSRTYFDPARCPGCKRETTERDRNAEGVFVCRCREWRLVTGAFCMPSGSEGEPPVEVRMRPEWSPVSYPAPARAEPGQPSLDRQDDILTTLRKKGTPLTRTELVEEMGLPGEGALGRDLAWMVKHGILVKSPRRRGYWPATDPVPM